MNDRLQSALHELRLSGLAQSLDVRLQEAAGHQLNHTEFLELILQDELLVRQQRQIDRRVKAAGFRELKPLDDFDWSFNPSIKRWAINHRMKAANALIEAACIDGERLHYLDTHSHLLGPDGQPVREYLSEDDLHLSEAGYERLTALVRPEVEKLLQAPASASPAEKAAPAEKAPTTGR